MTTLGKFPMAQQPPRVPRSTRDDQLQKGYALPAKRGGIGIVMTREGDTCTCLIMEELITGCIPLTAMPPVGAVVEVEARGDLMVILDWSDGIAQPVLGDWYFTPAESPDWTEGMQDTELGTGEQAGNPAPSGPGYLWNLADFKVRPGDVLTFSALLSNLSGAVTAQLAFIWDEHGVDPQPSTGEVLTYGTPVLVDTTLVEFSATATVPATFTGSGGEATTGRARLGLLLTGEAAATITVTSRPGTDVIAPADWEAGDNDVATSLTPTFATGEAHGAYGVTYVSDAANWLPFPTTGSETLPDLSGVVSQQAHVIYSSTWPVNLTIEEGDGGSLAFPGGGPAGTEVQLDSDVNEAGVDNLLQWASLFPYGTGAPELYAVTIHEWWIETVWAPPSEVAVLMQGDLLTQTAAAP